MASESIFSSLAGWEATRDTLHWYSKAVGVVPRTHAQYHPKWWHVSLKVQEDSLVTDEMPLPDGGSLQLRMDVRNHEVVLSTTHGDERRFSMQEGLSATAFGDNILAAVSGFGLKGEYAREKFENDDPRLYDPAQAERYLNMIVQIDRIFKHHRDSLSGVRGPVQLWPHGFDLAFEWFGTRTVEFEEHGEITQYPAQLNFGFSPGESSHPKPYFYSNPWPFEADQLVDQPLPWGARWFTESWQGSILPYSELVDDADAEAKLLAYLGAVYRISSPTLLAEVESA